MSNSPRRGMSPVLAFILGFLLALIVLLGAIGIAVGVALNYKIDKISQNKDSEGNYKYINADPENGGVGTVLDLVKKVQSYAKGFSTLTLEELETLSPAAGKLSVKLEEAMSSYVALEEGEIKKVPLGQLASFIQSLANRVDVARLIGATPDNSILCYLCYGVYSVKYDEVSQTYSALYKDEDGEEYECELQQNESNKLTGALYNDAQGEEKNTPYLTLDNVNERVEGLKNELKIKEIIPIPEDDKLLGSIKNSTINSIATDINNVCIQQLFANDVYAPKNSSDGTSAPNAEMYLAQEASSVYVATSYDEKAIYYTLKDSNYILAGANGKLTQAEYDGYSGGSLYTLGAGKILFDPSYVYYVKDEDEYALSNSGSNYAGKITSLDGKEYYTYGSANKLWQLLLYTEDSGLNAKSETVYSIKNVNNMITNVSKNTQETSLRDLDAAGILTFSDKSELEKRVRWVDAQGTHDKILGDMALTEVIGLMVLIVSNPAVLLPSV